MIILNEKKYAQYIYENKILDTKPFVTISLLAKYLIQVKQLSDKDVICEIDNFMTETYPGYIENEWYEIIQKSIKSAYVYNLIEIESIPITDKEIRKVESLESERLEKLAFSILCLTKYQSMKFSTDMHWTDKNMTLNQIFKFANVTCRKDERIKLLRELGLKGMINIGYKQSNFSCNYIESGTTLLEISDNNIGMTDLGNQYLVFKGTGYFCEKCKCYVRKKNGKYCTDCSGYKPKLIKIVKCIECGYQFNVSSRDNKTCRCEECNKLYKNNYQKELMKIRRNPSC